MNICKERLTTIEKSELLINIVRNMKYGENVVCLGNFLDKDMEAFFADLRSAGNFGIHHYKPSESVSESLQKASNIHIIGVSADTAINEYELENKKVDLLCLDLTSDFSTIIENFNRWIDIMSLEGRILLFGCELLTDGGIANFNSYLFVNMLLGLNIIDEGYISLSLLSAFIKNRTKIEHKDVGRLVIAVADRIAALKQHYSQEFRIYMQSGFSNTYSFSKNVYSHLKTESVDLELDKLSFSYIMEQIILENASQDKIAEHIQRYAYNTEVMNVINRLRVDRITFNEIGTSKSEYLLEDACDNVNWLYSLIEFEKLKLNIMLPIVNSLFNICRANIEVLNEVVNSLRFIHDNNINTVAIFGAGPTGEAYKEFFAQNGVEVKLFIDNNYFKYNTFNGIPVVEPSKAKQLESDIDLIVLASSGRKQEMKKQLIELGVFKPTYPYTHKGGLL